MKHRARYAWCVAALAAIVWLAPAAAPAQLPLGSIEFEALITPASGRPQPALGVPLHLLRKSFAAIQKEAEDSVPTPNLDEYVDSLELSPELKAWIKRSKVVRFADVEFGHRVSVDDLMAVPEFYEAYLLRNVADMSTTFPKPKFKAEDREKDPEKFDKMVQEYRAKVKSYAQKYPHTREGIEVPLAPLDPGPRWAAKLAERTRQIRQRALQLAGTTYLVARTESDVRGRGGFINVTPGQYWLTTLEYQGIVGDVRLRWDLPLTVRAGQPTRVELNNLNAVQPAVK